MSRKYSAQLEFSAADIYDEPRSFSQASEVPETKLRDLAWDNAKLVATTIVCFGNILQLYKYKFMENGKDLDNTSFDPTYAFYAWFHLFAAPSFVFLSGYFSRSFLSDGADSQSYNVAHRRLQTLLTKLLLVVCNSSFIHLLVACGDKKLSLQQDFGTCAFSNSFWDFKFEIFVQRVWYLLALFLWRTSLPFLAIFKWPILTSTVTALVMSLVDFHGSCVLQRTFGYLPFFALGAFIPLEYLEMLNVKSVRYSSLAASCFLLLASFIWQRELFHLVNEANTFEYDQEHPFRKLAYYPGTLCATVGFFAFVHLAFSKLSRTAAFARSTVYNYVLHLEILMACSWIVDWEDFFNGLSPWVQEPKHWIWRLSSIQP
ncbi:hypothetical protein CYMTET_20935 [Cymbomonas tetramitiformis]|uniref:Acyltransferase 3 domain-containing protein n=1 Tax=Cymbomonas tetramitiformis TaxID=36881 RepID=A0AAE0L3H7_9CHLO|nr:hypothetical protein CYMTET_20935 [Cymbomonas tetramitiformis]